jgi:hypothetical protein
MYKTIFIYNRVIDAKRSPIIVITLAIGEIQENRYWFKRKTKANFLQSLINRSFGT